MISRHFWPCFCSDATAAQISKECRVRPFAFLATESRKLSSNLKSMYRRDINSHECWIFSSLAFHVTVPCPRAVDHGNQILPSCTSFCCIRSHGSFLHVVHSVHCSPPQQLRSEHVTNRPRIAPAIDLASFNSPSSLSYRLSEHLCRVPV
jgi:hypothetical protein